MMKLVLSALATIGWLASRGSATESKAEPSLQTEIKLVNLFQWPVTVNISNPDGSARVVELQPNKTSDFFKLLLVPDPDIYDTYSLKLQVNNSQHSVNYTRLRPTGTDLIVIFPTPFFGGRYETNVERIATMSDLQNMNTKSPYEKNYVFTYSQLPTNTELNFDYFLRTSNCHNCSYQQLLYISDLYFNDNSVGVKSLKVVSYTTGRHNSEIVQMDGLQFQSRGVYAIIYLQPYKTWFKIDVVPPEPFYTPLLIALVYFAVVIVARVLYVKYYDKIEADQYYSVKKNIQNTSAMNEYVIEERIVEVDIMRGIFIVLFIVVNCGGGGYIFLNESVWDGMNLGDLPELGIGWVLGFSIPFVIKYKGKLYKHGSSFAKFILVKSLLFCGFGFSYNGNFDLGKFIYTGFFQRLGVALLVNTLVAFHFPFVRHDSERAGLQVKRVLLRSLCMLALPALNVLLTEFLPVPGCPTGYLRPGGIEAGSYHLDCTGGASKHIDKLVFGENGLRTNPTCAGIYRCSAFDKYGILGTLNFVFGVYLATLIGEGFIKFKAQKSRIVYILAYCLSFLLMITVSIIFMDEYFLIPINRSLYSVSFVLLGSFFVNLFFILLTYFRSFVLKFTGWPFIQVGYNGLAILFMQEVCKDILPFGFLNNGNHRDLIVCALMNVTIWVFFALTLHNYKFYIKI